MALTLNRLSHRSDGRSLAGLSALRSQPSGSTCARSALNTASFLSRRIGSSKSKCWACRTMSSTSLSSLGCPLSSPQFGCPRVSCLVCSRWSSAPRSYAVSVGGLVSWIGSISRYVLYRSPRRCPDRLTWVGYQPTFRKFSTTCSMVGHHPSIRTRRTGSSRCSKRCALEKRYRVSILSGDAHVGGVGEIYSARRPRLDKVDDELFMYQIISSAVMNSPAAPGRRLGADANQLLTANRRQHQKQDAKGIWIVEPTDEEAPRP